MQSLVANSAQVILPILSELIQGKPEDSPVWDGSRVEVSGIAAARAQRATQPYVLRSPIEDKLGRIKKNDLLLIDQHRGDGMLRARIGRPERDRRLPSLLQHASPALGLGLPDAGGVRVGCVRSRETESKTFNKCAE